ncbi:MAG: ELM1/GtrOC1 family putative glycosyltransferase, partial [Alphaproteobacteria bacterium]
ADGHALGEVLAKLSAESGGGLLITASRRTPAPSFAALESALAGAPAYVWRGEGANPYLGFLALADAVLVTADSVSMVSDACASGKPVHILALAGRRSARFARFFDRLEAEGAVRPFTGTLDSWAYEPLNDCALAAGEIRRRLEMRKMTEPKTAQQTRRRV